MFAAFWGIVGLVFLSLLRRRTRPPLSRVIQGCVKGAVTGAKVAVACATLGPIIALVTKTGLGLLVGYSVEAWSGGSLFLALAMSMGCVIILGLEVPTVAAYLVGAMVAIPALVRLGLEPIQAHMFAFYFGAFSGLTPPVGMAAIVASRIADARYIRTALYSMGAAGAGFLVPYVFAYNGSLLFTPGTSLGGLAVTVFLVILGLGLFQVGLVGFFLARLNLWERLGTAAGGLALLAVAAVGASWLIIPAVAPGRVHPAGQLSQAPVRTPKGHTGRGPPPCPGRLTPNLGRASLRSSSHADGQSPGA